jgi:GNAT superfamily N-acetyltransferase
MTNTDSVDRAVVAWHAVIEAFCELQPKGTTKQGAHGTRMITSGTPVAVLNGVISATREPDVTELSAFAASYADDTLPWSIQLRGDRAYPAVAQVAAERGLTKSFTLPFMVKQLGKADMSMPASATMSVRRVPTEDHGVYNRVLAAGFEAPEHIFRGFSAPNVLSAEGMTAYLVEEAGTPVATAFGARVSDYVGVFNIATPPAYRLRGYARAATAAVLRDAYASGARTAFLHCTPAGRAVYESLGFATAENWLIYVAP